jgi:hypothetical protein
MPHHLGLRTVELLALASITILPACGKDKIQGPEAEVKKVDVKLELPPVPPFDLPPAPGDGSHTVKELRVKGKKLFDTSVTVKGIVTFAYDCPTAIRTPDEKDKDVLKRIEDDPTLCQRPKFYIGDTAQTAVEKSLWVVDVPRPYNKQEIKNIQKRDRIYDPNNPKCEPDERDKAKQWCPPYAVGDEVVITGDFKMSSPHSERNSDGLLVFKSMKNTTKNWESPPPPPPPAGAPTSTAPTAPTAPTKPSPQDLVNKKPAHG